MSKTLGEIAKYSTDRVSIDELSLSNYVSTDNLLQLKLGKVDAEKLPPQGGNVTGYEKGDILVSNIRPYLKKIWFANTNGGNSADVLTFSVDNSNNSKFVYYALFRDVFFNHMMNGAKGTKMPRGDKRQILDFSIPDFSIQTQSQIAKVLSDLDAKIELNNKINAELEAMAKLIYDYWFVQFDFPNENGLPYKSSGGKMVWNEELKREIPEGWEVKFLNEIASIKTGKLDSNAEVINGEYYFYTCASEPTRTDTYAFDDAVILIAGNNASGNFHVNRFEGKFNAYQRTYVLTVNEQQNLDYLYHVVVGKMKIYKYQGRGSQTKFLTIGMLNNIPVFAPNNKVMSAFSQITNPMYDKQVLIMKENQKLAQLRDWLLPMLMNGQVKVVEQAKASIIPLEKPLIPSMVAEEAPIYEAKNAKVQRKMLATFIINESLNDPNFGKTKFEKLLHLVEYHVLKREFNQTYSVQAAGPYDGKFTVLFWKEVLKGKWFAIEEKGYLKRIVAGANHEKSLKDYGYLSEDDKLAICSFIGLFKGNTYKEPEIISTLFAVWNNRIIQKELITDALLKKDFLEWDEQKVKYADRVEGALVWMREKGIVPDGWGKVIGRAKGKK